MKKFQILAPALLLTLISCNTNGRIKLNEINSISSSEVLARSEIASVYIKNKLMSVRSDEQSKELIKFMEEQTQVYNTLLEQKQSDPEILLAAAYISRSLKYESPTAFPGNPAIIEKDFQHFLMLAFRNASIESPIFPKIYKDINIDITNREKARLFSLYSLNKAKNTDDILHWMNEAYKLTNGLPSEDFSGRQKEMTELNIIFKKFNEDKSNQSISTQIAKLINDSQNVVDIATLQLKDLDSNSSKPSTDIANVDTTDSISQMLAKANSGNAGAQYALGMAYNEGNGVAQDKAEAIKWFRSAADLGEANAQCQLGFNYMQGDGVPLDKSEAFKWWHKAAENGNSVAQYNLGLAYGDGKDMPKDLTESFKWYLKAAEQGLANAQNNIGTCYVEGRGVALDNGKAMEWYEKAAAQGNEKAKRNLSTLQSKYGPEHDLILNGIARDAGYSFQELMGLAKIHPTFARRLNSILFGRQMVMNAEKQYGQYMPFTDSNEISNLVQDAKLPYPY
jgi:TPR repeat protein